MNNAIKPTVNIAVYLDDRRQKKDGRFPVKIRVTYNRERRYYPTGKDLTKEEFERAMGSRPRNEAKDIRIYFDSLLVNARTIADSIPAFNFPEFERGMVTGPKIRNSVFEAFESYIESLRRENRVSTAASYGNALKAIRTFVKRPKLEFQEITPEWLLSFETWITTAKESDKAGKVTKRPGTTTTAGIYIRSLRTIYNQAISQKVIQGDSYPFGRNQYKIPNGRNVKKALSKDSLRKLFEYDPEPGPEAYHRDLWLFSYLCNGANMKDIARLKYANIDGDRVSFIRSKTERSTKQDLKPIIAALPEKAKDIIAHWGHENKHPQAYVFPILEPGCTPQRERELVQGIVKQVNKYIRRIAAKVGIEDHLTTYTARHSFATVLKQSHAPISYISEAMGHKDLKTTENYLGSFDDATRNLYAAALTDF